MQRLRRSASPATIRCHEPAFSTRAERTDGQRGLVGDGELDLAMLVDAPGEASQLAMGIVVAGPGVGVMEEPGREAVGVFGEGGRDGVEELVPRAVRVGAPSPSRCATCGWPTRNRQSASSVVSPVRWVWKPSINSMPPPAAAGREDRDAGLAERLDVAQDRCARRPRASRRGPAPSCDRAAATPATCRAPAPHASREVTSEHDTDVWFAVAGCAS